VQAINCERCGKLFMSLSSKSCPECREVEDNWLRKAKEVLYRQPQLDMMGLANEAEIPIDAIEEFVRQGRLMFRKAAVANLTCELCGKPLNIGKRCDACNNRIISMVRQSIGRKEEERVGMHSLRINKARKEEG